HVLPYSKLCDRLLEKRKLFVPFHLPDEQEKRKCRSEFSSLLPEIRKALDEHGNVFPLINPSNVEDHRAIYGDLELSSKGSPLMGIRLNEKSRVHSERSHRNSLKRYVKHAMHVHGGVLTNSENEARIANCLKLKPPRKSKTPGIPQWSIEIRE